VIHLDENETFERDSVDGIFFGAYDSSSTGSALVVPCLKNPVSITSLENLAALPAHTPSSSFAALFPVS
jgi:hypothetical protein